MLETEQRLEGTGIEEIGQQKRLEINVNIARHKEYLLNELNTRRLRTRDITVSPPVVPPRSSSVPLNRIDRVDRLADDEEPDSEVGNSIRDRAHAKKHVRTELDTDQGE